MTSEITVQCPAKINLDLKVINKREDGFHNIKSVMQTISLYDFLKISVESSDTFEINLSGNSNEIPYNEKNLVCKTAELFIETADIKPHRINIYIEKNIPVSAGLAGGSTDGAGTLYGLNKIFNNPLSGKELHMLCAMSGSDLNFCLEGGRQMTSDRGEILEPLEFEEFTVSLIKPDNFGISAKEAYTKFTEKKSSDFKSAFGSRDKFKNDLEWAVIDDYEELKFIKNHYADSVMSGSGSSYYIIGKEFKNHKGYKTFNNLKSIPYGIKDLS